MPKPGARFLFTVDLQAVNVFTVRHHFSIQNLEHELCSLAGAVYFANFDMSNGYWQLLLARLFQECKFFITSDGIF